MRTNKQKIRKSDGLAITVWRQGKENTSQVYMFQLQAKSIRLLKKVVKAIQGTNSGIGYDKKKKENIMLIKKCFSSVDKFKEFINNFEYKVERVR